MSKIHSLLSFAFGGAFGLSGALALIGKEEDNIHPASPASESFRTQRAKLLCEGGTLDDLSAAIDFYVKGEKSGETFELGSRLANLRFDRLLCEAYIAESYPNSDSAERLLHEVVQNSERPRTIESAEFELERAAILEALTRSLEESSARLSDNLLVYLGSVIPEATFDLNWSRSHASGRLGDAEIIAGSWLAADPAAAIQHLSNVGDLPSSIRLMLVQCMASGDIGSAIGYIDDSPEFTRGLLVEALIDVKSSHADEGSLLEIFKHFFEEDSTTHRLSGQYYRSGLKRLVETAQSRAPELTKLFVDGIVSPDVRDFVTRRTTN